MSYVFAAWSGPTATPPDGNTDAPVNVGIVDQIKDAGLGVNALSVFGRGLFSGEVQIGSTGLVCDSSVEGSQRYNSVDKVMEYCDGTNWQAFGSGRGGSGGLLGAPKVFDSSGTYNKNELASRVVVWVVGGGGGAGGTITNRRGGAGAGGGTCIKTIESSSIGVTETVTIGAGGIAAGRNAFANGGSGGTSLFGSHCSATGGNGGGGSNAGGVNVKGGIGIDGDLNIAGGTGTTGKNSQGMMFGGGGTFIGGGGPASTDGRAYGGGAGMVDTWSNANGAAGVVVVWEYS